MHLPARLRWASSGPNDVILPVSDGGLVEEAYDGQLVNPYVCVSCELVLAV